MNSNKMYDFDCDATFKPRSQPELVYESNWEIKVEKFDDMGLKKSVLHGIYGYGFNKPTPIQQKAIMPIIQGKDVIA